MSANARGDLSDSLIQPHADSSKASTSAPSTLEGEFTLRGSTVQVTLADDVISWRPVGKTKTCCCCCNIREGEVALHDVVGINVDKKLTRWKDVLLKLTGALTIHTYQHNPKRYQELHLVQITLKAKPGTDIKQWEKKIREALENVRGRPKRLLVFVNPFGGKRQAPITWALKAKPMMDMAGIEAEVVNTERAGHAEETVTALTLEEAERLDGIVAVGGDGLFHEIVNGLLSLRAQKEGEPLAGIMRTMRLGHIPAGSTDTVAYTLHGTRSVTTAVLRIVLGERIPLDVARLDMLQSKTHTFAVSMIAYGYMGDLLKESELWRCLGPLRYEYVGAKVLFRSRVYSAKVSYLAANAIDLEDATPDHALHAQRGICMANCLHCASSAAEGGAVHFSKPARRISLLDGQEKVGWTILEGTFRSIMIVVIPCRSNKSQYGVIPGSHLADGRMHLVLVNECSNLQYLRFLLGINSRGLQDGMFDFVKMVPIKAVQVRPSGRESSWNCDGELLEDNHISVRAHQGLVQVFARGVDHHKSRPLHHGKRAADGPEDAATGSAHGTGGGTGHGRGELEMEPIVLDLGSAMSSVTAPTAGRVSHRTPMPGILAVPVD